MSAPETFNLPPVVFILGGPGSGKGTQCEQLLAAVDNKTIPGLPNKVYHINVGGILRGAQTEYRRQLQENCVTEAMSKAGPVLEEMLAAGQILPSWVTVTLLKEKLKLLGAEIEEQKQKDPSYSGGVLIDGFPRSIENLESYESIIGTARRLIVLDVPDDVMTQRILSRSIDSGREDDTEEVIKKRLSVFSSQTGAVMQFYTITANADEALAAAQDPKNIRIGVKINGNRPVDQVTPEFMQAFITLTTKL